MNYTIIYKFLLTTEVRLHKCLDITVPEILSTGSKQLLELGIGNDPTSILWVLEVILFHIITNKLRNIYSRMKLILVPTGELPDVI